MLFMKIWRNKNYCIFFYLCCFFLNELKWLLWFYWEKTEKNIVKQGLKCKCSIKSNISNQQSEKMPCTSFFFYHILNDFKVRFINCVAPLNLDPAPYNLTFFARYCPSLTGLLSWKSQLLSQYWDSNPESLDTGLNIKTEIFKVSIPVSISRLQF